MSREPLVWRKSGRSGPQGNCVEVGAGPGSVRVRDSKDPGSAVLEFDRRVWARFLAAVRDGGLASCADHTNEWYSWRSSGSSCPVDLRVRGESAPQGRSRPR